MTDRYKHLWKVAGIGAALILLYSTLQNFSTVIGVTKHFLSIFFPLFLGCCIAFVLNIPMSLLEKLFGTCKKRWMQKIKRPVSILLSIVIIVALLYLIINLVVPELIKGGKVLVDSLSTAFDKFDVWWAENSGKHPQLAKFLHERGIDINNLQSSLIVKLQGWTPKLISNTLAIITSGISGIINFFMALVFALYILTSKEKLTRQFSRLFEAFISVKAERRFMHIASTTYQTFAKFVVGQCTEAVILGTLCAIGMLIFRMPYAVMIGALVGVTALIPIVGAFLGAGVGAFMIAMVNPLTALGFVIYLIILQQIEGNLIYPRVVGSSVGLPAIWVFAAVMVGGGLGGLVGMVFAVPTTSVCYKLIREEIAAREMRKAMASQSAGGETADDNTGTAGDSAATATDPMTKQEN